MDLPALRRADDSRREREGSCVLDGGRRVAYVLCALSLSLSLRAGTVIKRETAPKPISYVWTSCCDNGFRQFALHTIGDPRPGGLQRTPGSRITVIVSDGLAYDEATLHR